MSIRSRLIDLARANLNALLERIPGEARVEDLSDTELEAELERRLERRLREEATREAAEAAERAAWERRPGDSQKRSDGARSRARTDGARSKTRTDSGLAPLYATLEVPIGADPETIKRSFRRLMRTHHPDMHASDPTAAKRATERAAKITTAYEELTRRLGK